MRTVLWVALCVCVLSLLVSTSANAQRLAQETKDTLSQVSLKGLFRVQISIVGKNLNVGKNNAEILVHDKDGIAVIGARVFALPHIFRHGESTLVKPTVTEKAKGRYAIENIYIEIPGHWVLKITIRKGDQEDTVNFDFPEVKRAT